MKSSQDTSEENKGLQRISKNMNRDYDGDSEESDKSRKRFYSKKKSGTRKMGETEFKRKIYVETTSESDETDCNDSATEGRKSRLSLRSGKKVRRYNLTTNHQWKRKDFEKMRASRKQFKGHFMFPIKSGHIYDEKTILEFCERMKQGESSRSLASEIGACVETVRLWRKKYVPELGHEKKVIQIYNNKTVFEACNRLLLGDSEKQVSEDFRTDIQTIRSWRAKYIKDGELQLAPSPRRFDRKRILELCERMKQGESSRSIASEIGADVKTVRSWRMKYAPELEPEVRKICIYNNEMVFNACNRLINGDSVKKVADEFQVTVPTVKSWKAKYIEDGKLKLTPSAKRFDQETILKLCERMKQGESSKSIAFETGAWPETVRRWRKKYVPELGPEKKIFPVYDENTIIEACNDLLLGNSIVQVSKKFGTSYNTINEWKSRFIKDGKVQLTKRKNRFHKKRILELCERMKHGESTKSIASEIGACVETVRLWRKKYVPELDPEARKICVYDSETVLNACNRLILGDSLKEVSEKFGTVINTVKEWQAKYIQDGKVQILLDSRRIDEETVLELCERMKQGETSKSVASDTGLSLEAIRRWRKKYVPELGPEERINQVYDNETVLKACKCLLRGDSLKEVSEKFGTVINTVKEWQAKYIQHGKVRIPLDSRRIDEETILELCERMKQGETSKSVASSTGLSLGAIRRWRKKYVPELGPEEMAHQIYDNDTVLEACKCLLRGDSLKDVSEQFGTAINTVKNWQDKYIKNGKVQLPSDSRRISQETILELCERMRQGESSRSIAFEIGANIKTVREWRKKYVPDIEPEIRDVTAYDNSTVLEACNRLISGDSAHIISKSLQIDVKIIKGWQTKYIKNGKVQLTRRANRYDQDIKRKICKRLKRGESASDLAMEFGISCPNINNWKQKYIVEGLQVTGLKKRCSESRISQTSKRLKSNDVFKAATKDVNSGCKVNQKSNQDRLVQRKKITSKSRMGNNETTMTKRCDELNQGYYQREASTRTNGVSQSIGIFKCVSGKQTTLVKRKNLRSKTKMTSARSDEPWLTTDPIYNNAGLSDSLTRQQLARSKTFVPFNKVCIPNGLKLEVVELIGRGISISQLSKELSINGVTLASWALNKNLLMNQSMGKTSGDTSA